MVLKKFASLLCLIAMLIGTSTALAENETAIFAGGCFWCLQADFDKIPGVISTTVGYDGGSTPNPSYSKVSSGKTNYVESVKVIYDTEKVSYQQLLTTFWHNIDPLDKGGQFCDRGKQYRSAIFYLNQQQYQMAQDSKEAVKKKLAKTVYTNILPSTQFYPAEAYHQKYYKNHSIRYKFYRLRCGRDKRLKEIWGES
ncbi:MAG: peptide-methionine (S)-S-oxide reductase MsrA [Pseudomonadota bacterium]